MYHLRLMATADCRWSMAVSIGLAFLAQVLVGELVGLGLVALAVALALVSVGEPGPAA